MWLNCEKGYFFVKGFDCFYLDIVCFSGVGG